VVREVCVARSVALAQDQNREFQGQAGVVILQSQEWRRDGSLGSSSRRCRSMGTGNGWLLCCWGHLAETGAS